MTMTTNKQALSEAALEESRFRSEGSTSDYWAEIVTPEEVLALLDEIEAAEKRIAELDGRTIALPPYAFFDFRLGSQFKSGAYCHVDTLLKELAAAGISITTKGE